MTDHSQMSGLFFHKANFLKIYQSPVDFLLFFVFSTIIKQRGGAIYA